MKMIIKLYFIYIIENQTDKSWYVGFSTDYARRLEEHNEKIGGHYTKHKSGEWKMLYVEGYISKKDALGREKYLKSGAGRKYLKKQLRNYIAERIKV